MVYKGNGHLARPISPIFENRIETAPYKLPLAFELRQETLDYLSAVHKKSQASRVFFFRAIPLDPDTQSPFQCP
eukprot:scaffold82001_cov13-Tisochrysis_lutea.AAC.1